jgi:hypothetical protein
VFSTLTLHLFEQNFKATDQDANISVERLQANLHGLSPSETQDLVGQITFSWHGRTANQDRDDRYCPSQALSDLHLDVIHGIIDAPLSAVVSQACPLRADYDDEHVAPAKSSQKRQREVSTWEDVIDVKEERLLPEHLT